MTKFLEIGDVNITSSLSNTDFSIVKTELLDDIPSFQPQISQQKTEKIIPLIIGAIAIGLILYIDFKHQNEKEKLKIDSN